MIPETQMALYMENIGFSVPHGFMMRMQPILTQIDIQLMPSTILGLLGANGAGKTTTLSIGAGLLKPSSGRVRVFGKSFSDHSVKKRVGYLPEVQYPPRYSKLSEWLWTLGVLSGMKKAELKNRISRLYDAFDLEKLSNRYMRTFSKGQQQRAALCQALLHRPDVLILDEPLSGLDSYWRRQFKTFLVRFKAAGGAAIFSSHVSSDIKEIADEVVCLDTGRIRWTSDIQNFSSRLYLEKNDKNFDPVLFQD